MVKATSPCKHNNNHSLETFSHITLIVKMVQKLDSDKQAKIVQVPMLLLYEIGGNRASELSHIL